MQYLQFKRGTHDETMKYVGPCGELVVDTDEWKIRLMDGKIPGGLVVCSVILTSDYALLGFDTDAGRFVGNIYAAEETRSADR